MQTEIKVSEELLWYGQLVDFQKPVKSSSRIQASRAAVIIKCHYGFIFCIDKATYMFF